VVEVRPWTASRRRPIEPVAATSDLVATDDRSIVDAVLGGDRDAFRALVERESTAVVRACHRILGDLDDAEDAAQEAFVIAFRSLSSWRAEGPLGAWVTRIAVRLALRRASKRRPIAWRNPSGVDPEEPVIPGGPDPAIESLRAERAADVRSAVARLGEPYRETVALRFFGELSLAEIASETGRPIGTIKTHLHRGLQRLRDDLETRR
jgi:RNA polymerase sigma-70 factor (ECF subfamily)